MESANTTAYGENKLFTSMLFGLRMVSGWLFFSAFLRRVILVPEKLDPASMEYVGIKFNTFLPHAVGIQSILEFLLTHTYILFPFLILFTIIEGVCGLALIFGFFTRIAAFGTTCLSFGILLGAGWLGSTCLDEWQIGVTGVASGITLMLAGSGYFSLDNLFFGKRISGGNHNTLIWFTSGKLPVPDRVIKIFSLCAGIVAIFITLWSNQVLHGGVWGKLFNKSKEPLVVVSATYIDSNKLSFDVYRTNGPDTYGAFIVEMYITDLNDKTIWKYEFAENGLNNKASSGFSIDNIYVSKVRMSKYSLEIPLGAKARVETTDNTLMKIPKGAYTLSLVDVSGDVWKQNFRIE